MIRRSFFKSTGVFIIAKYLNIPGLNSWGVNLSLLDPKEKRLVKSFIHQMENELKHHRLGATIETTFFEPISIILREQEDDNFTVSFTNKYEQVLTLSKSGSTEIFKVTTGSA